MPFQVFVEMAGGGGWRALDRQAWPTLDLVKLRAAQLRGLTGLQGRSFQIRQGSCAELRDGGGVVVEQLPPMVP